MDNCERTFLQLRREYLSLQFKGSKTSEKGARLGSIEKIVLAWPRKESNDPYAQSLTLLAKELKRMGGYDRVWVAFNEFCKPTLEEALAEASSSEVDMVIVLTMMTTQGEAHAEGEIPEVIEGFKCRNHSKEIVYPLPFDMKHVARSLVEMNESYVPRAGSSEACLRFCWLGLLILVLGGAC